MLEHNRNVKGKKIRHEVLFEVFSGDKTWRVYTNGKTEGFPSDSTIHNHFPVILPLYLEDFRKTLSHPCVETIGETAITPIGESHLVPA